MLYESGDQKKGGWYSVQNTLGKLKNQAKTLV